MAGEWQDTQLAEVATIASGKRPVVVSKEPTPSCQVPVIGGGGPSGFTETALYDSLILITGRVGTLGKLFAPSGPCWPSDNALVILPRGSRTDVKFLRYALQLVISEAVGMNRGAANPLITQSDLGRLVIGHPPLIEQRAIAHILGMLDDKIELNRRMSETLEAMARALFKSWFVDFDPVRAKMEGRDPGLPQALADLFPARLVDSELGEIPEGWLTAALADAIEIVDGRTLSSSMRDDGGRFRAFGANGPIAQSKEAWVDSPCIILGKIGTCGALHRSPAPCWVTNNAFAVLAGRSRSLEFAWHILKVIDFSNYVGGSANPYMPLKNFGHHLIVLPPPEVLEPFQLLAVSLRSRVEAAETQSRTLAALRDALLPKLISGELRVPDAEAFLKARDP